MLYSSLALDVVWEFHCRSRHGERSALLDILCSEEVPVAVFIDRDGVYGGIDAEIEIPDSI